MSFRIATVGHVDHGKSTLIGRLLADTGQTRDDRQAKVRSYCESEGRKFEFAFLLDALEEEQAQGITIDVTEVPWNFAGQAFTFVDTPGHREFLKKMVGGASRVDAAILLVDVVEGILGSLRRQLRVLELLGVRNLVLLVNKMDLVGWREEAWLAREREIRALLSGSKARIHVLPAAAWHGANLLKRCKEMPWYEGPTLVEAMLEMATSSEKIAGPARFRVQDVYRFEDQRILVGRMESGELRAGDRLAFYPSGQESTVRSIEVYGEERTLAQAGEAIGITLADPLYLDRGALGFSPGSPPLLARGAVADLFWLSPEALKVGTQLILKCGTQRAEAKVARVLGEIDADSFEENAGAKSVRLFGRVELSFSQPLAFDRFDQCEPTGRFVACVEGQVCGGGRWVDPLGKGARSELSVANGQVLWLTGLSGAGKSTIAAAVKRDLERTGQLVVVLDGDELRKGLCQDLGFSAEDRRENLRRAAEVAKLFVEKGFVVITAFISPLAEHREMARSIIGKERFREVFVDAPLSVCERRDVKGLYRKARLGEIPEFTGVSAPFEAPATPDLHVSTTDGAVEESARLVFEFLQNIAFEDDQA